ncbi:MAG: methyltransferase domain-containing protein [Ignavibacteriae bacterium]|nr:methyltransferase domain-containing protein [Ignavibacteriota bacterium]
MKKDLVNILECPQTHKGLTMEVFKEEDGDILDGMLYTDSSWYAIFEGVPRMVPDKWFSKKPFADRYKDKFPQEVLPLIDFSGTVTNNNKHQQTIGVFTNEWSKYQNVGWNIATEDFNKKTLFYEENMKDKLVLDVGCGNGRYCYAATLQGANVIGVDLNDAIHFTYKNVKKHGVQCVQGDILNLPFKKDTFNFIFSIGVLHHTQDTENGFKGLVPLLDKGGKISTTYYRKGTIMRELTDNVIRFFSTKMPDKMVWRLSYIPSTIAKILRLIPVFKKYGNWIHVDQIVHTAIVHMRPQHDICYDWWAPKIANRYKKSTIHSWYEDVDLNNISEIYYGPNAVAFKGVK